MRVEDVVVTTELGGGEERVVVESRGTWWCGESGRGRREIVIGE